jgi:hypothetical protein
MELQASADKQFLRRRIAVAIDKESLAGFGDVGDQQLCSERSAGEGSAGALGYRRQIRRTASNAVWRMRGNRLSGPKPGQMAMRATVLLQVVWV